MALDMVSGLIRPSHFLFEGGGRGKLPEIGKNLPRTCGKLHSKGKPYRFSNQRDPSVHTDSNPVTFISGLKYCRYFRLWTEYVLSCICVSYSYFWFPTQAQLLQISTLKHHRFQQYRKFYTKVLKLISIKIKMKQLIFPNKK